VRLSGLERRISTRGGCVVSGRCLLFLLRPVPLDLRSVGTRRKKTWAEMAELVLLREVLRKVYTCCPKSADAESHLSELGRIVSVDKTSLKDSTVMQKAVLAADVRLRNRLAREAHG
jgi:hypothetical protein